MKQNPLLLLLIFFTTQFECIKATNIPINKINETKLLQTVSHATLEDLVEPSYVQNIEKPNEPHQYTYIHFPNTCYLNTKYFGQYEFLSAHLEYYPTINTHITNMIPYFVFFTDETDSHNSIVSAVDSTEEELLTILKNLENDPTFYEPKHSYFRVFLSQRTTLNDIIELLERVGVKRSITPDPKKRVTLYDQQPFPSTPPSFDLEEALRNHSKTDPLSKEQYHDEL